MDNKRLLIKVCGMTDRENMQAVIRLQPDFLGFILYPPSPRDVSGRIGQIGLRDIPAGIKKVAVLVNPPLTEALAVVRHYGFDAVQLHGGESPAMCRDLRRECLVIKSFPVGDCLPENLGEYEGICDYFLFDTAGSTRGGSGHSFDHRLLQGYKGSTPFFIAGGISPADAEAIAALPFGTLCGADLNSRFEFRPGIKDPVLLAQFFNKIKMTDKRNGSIH
jgi:phosphoribosylanthranilate isomerase